jgi:hypothetical protein
MIVIRVLYYCCARGNRARRKRVNMAKRTHSAKKLLKQLPKFPACINYSTAHSLLNMAVFRIVATSSMVYIFTELAVTLQPASLS